MLHLDLRLGLVAASVAVLGAAACGGSSPPAGHVAGSAGQGGAAAAASPAALTSARRSRVWLAGAACPRAHGADEPDPTLDQDGNPR